MEVSRVAKEFSPLFQAAFSILREYYQARCRQRILGIIPLEITCDDLTFSYKSQEMGDGCQAKVNHVIIFISPCK